MKDARIELCFFTLLLRVFKTVEGLNGIAVEPTGLESTSIMLAYGLDLFQIPISPSKQFDMLDINFNFVALAGALALLVVTTIVLHYLNERKKLNTMWA